VRREACAALTPLGSSARSAAPALVAALIDDDLEVAQRAAAALAGIDLDALQRLQRQAIEDKGEKPAKLACVFAGAASAFLSQLRLALESGNAASRCRSAASVGGDPPATDPKLVPEVVVPALARGLKEENPSHRQQAGRGLGIMRLEAGEAMPALQ